MWPWQTRKAHTGMCLHQSIYLPTFFFFKADLKNHLKTPHSQTYGILFFSLVVFHPTYGLQVQCTCDLLNMGCLSSWVFSYIWSVENADFHLPQWKWHFWGCIWLSLHLISLEAAGPIIMHLHIAGKAGQRILFLGFECKHMHYLSTAVFECKRQNEITTCILVLITWTGHLCSAHNTDPHSILWFETFSTDCPLWWKI